jgi:D-sedoheptulose 7-phosphate isomerase
MREELIELYIKNEIDILSKINTVSINKFINLVNMTQQKRSTIYVCGNGGSALTASHISCDFNKCLNEFYENKFNVVCLNDNVGIITALANDISYEDIYSKQLINKLKREDLLIVISGSGNSNNVIKAAKYAKMVGTYVVSLTGFDGGKLKTLSDFDINIPISNMQIVEDVHLMISHLIAWSIITERSKKE